MIYGIGTDIVEIDRIAAKMERGTGLRDLVFTPHEKNYCEAQVNPFESYAARFAAKEAFLKAMGTGWGHGKINFNEIEVRNEETGKPVLQLIGNATSCYSELQIKQILVSLSHVKTMAIAMVVIEI